MSPLERTEAFYQELVRWYGDGCDREVRAASKLLLVALEKFEQNAGAGWQDVVREYVDILANDPQRYARMLDAQRGETKQQPHQSGLAD